MASGQTLLSFVPEGREYLSGYSPQARLMVRNLRTMLEFPRVTSGNLYLACFTGIVPYHYDGGGINFKITYAGANGEDYSNTATFNMAIELLVPGTNLNLITFSAPKTGIQVPNNGGQTQVAEITFSEAGSLVAGSLFRFYLTVDSPASIAGSINTIYVLAIDVEEV